MHSDKELSRSLDLAIDKNLRVTRPLSLKLKYSRVRKCTCASLILKDKWLISTAGLGFRLGFLSYAEIGSRDPSPSLCSGNMLYIILCSRRVWNPNLNSSPAVEISQKTVTKNRHPFYRVSATSVRNSGNCHLG